MITVNGVPIREYIKEKTCFENKEKALMAVKQRMINRGAKNDNL